jgi:carbon storage regulator
VLILTRKAAEEIVIGDGPKKIVIRLVEIRGEKARLGIAAPDEVPVHRREVYEKIHGSTNAA